MRDKQDLYSALQKIAGMLEAGKVHWANVAEFNERDVEELKAMFQYIHTRAKDMAYRPQNG